MARGRWCRTTEHRAGGLGIVRLTGISQPYISRKEKGPDFRPALLVMGFIRPHPGAQKGGAATLGSLSRPRHGQNPYANPERTAKSVMPLYLAYATVAINNYLGTAPPPAPRPGKPGNTPRLQYRRRPCRAAACPGNARDDQCPALSKPGALIRCSAMIQQRATPVVWEPFHLWFVAGGGGAGAERWKIG